MGWGLAIPIIERERSRIHVDEHGSMFDSIDWSVPRCQYCGSGQGLREVAFRDRAQLLCGLCGPPAERALAGVCWLCGDAKSDDPLDSTCGEHARVYA